MATKSNCYCCGKTVTKGYAKRHCLSHNYVGDNSEECMLLKVECAYDKDYWLYVDIGLKNTLRDLDKFLRAIWLECCGHMSTFYHVLHEKISFSHKIDSFAENTVLLYDYDFGSTTRLTITFVGRTTREKRPKKNAVRLLLRNEPFSEQCSCGKKAEYICDECNWNNDYPFFCKECAEQHENEEEHYLLPVVNSPRMGVCGYTGELDTYIFNPDDYT